MADNNDLSPEQLEQREKALERQRQIVGEITPAKSEEDIAAEKEAADAEAKKVADEAAVIEAKKKEEEDAAAAEVARLAAEKSPIDIASLSNEDLLKLISERTGANIASLDDLKPKASEEDKKKEQEQREANRVAYGLQKGHYNNADFQAYIADLKNPADLVFEQYKIEALAEDADLDEEDIAFEFKQKFGLDAEEGTRKWKRGQNELSLLADGLIKQRHEKILKANAEFDNNEAKSVSEKEFTAKINKALPAYNADVTEAMGKVGKRVFTAKDGEKYEVPIDSKILTSLQEKILDPQFAAQQIANGYTKESLQGMIELAAVADSLDNIVASAIEQALLRKQAGLRAIPPNGAHRVDNVDEPELSDEKKRAIQIMKDRVPVPQSAN